LIDYFVCVRVSGCFNPSLFYCSAQGLGENPLELLDETYPAKTKGMELLYDKSYTVLISTDLDLSIVTDRRSDGRWHMLSRALITIITIMYVR